MERCDLMVPRNNVSYLRARDPSILAFGRPHLAELAGVRTNLIPELENVSDSKQNENIRVYLRIKNGYDFEDLYAISGDTLTCNVPENSTCMRNMRDGDSLKKMFTFTKIFDPVTSQSEIFNSIVKPKILDFINGENSTLLTYGVSGSGKTFTVIGTDNDPGIVPRSLEYLFRTLPQLSKNPVAKPEPNGDVTILSVDNYKKEKQVRKNLLNASSLLIDKHQHVRTYTTMQQRLSGEPVAILEESTNVSLAIWVSFAEIYNEQIYDLLQPDPPRGKQRSRLRLGCSNGNTYIKGLTNISVSSGLEAYQILQFGIHNLKYASTLLNKHSSRSHSIFTIKLVQVSESDGGTYTSSFNFCDLAGSERSKKTLNMGDRLRESNNINSSLMVLGRCISAIRSSQKQNDHKLVPFRESKLTQLFQKALAGHEDIAMIVNISPKLDMFDETQHVLNFSAVAKQIAIDRKPVLKKQSRFSQLLDSRRGIAESTTTFETEDDVEKLRNAVLFLQNELEQQRNEFEINEKINRDYILGEVKRIMQEKDEDANRRVNDAEECVTKLYQIKMDNMKKKYERLLKEESERKPVIINLDDSEDEEVDQLKEVVDDLKGKIAELEKTVSRLNFELETKELECTKLNEKNLKLGVELLEAKKTLEDAVKDYVELQQDFNQTDNKCLLLENELYLYESQVLPTVTDSESNHEEDTDDISEIKCDLCQHSAVDGTTSPKLVAEVDSFKLPMFPKIADFDSKFEDDNDFTNESDEKETENTFPHQNAVINDTTCSKLDNELLDLHALPTITDFELNHKDDSDVTNEIYEKEDSFLHQSAINKATEV